ncbi:unnamed protein product [Aspergillus oryzae]|nr:unnamed protein product [Aspergillus oryzae]
MDRATAQAGASRSTDARSSVDYRTQALRSERRGQKRENECGWVVVVVVLVDDEDKIREGRRRRLYDSSSLSVDARRRMADELSPERAVDVELKMSDQWRIGGYVNDNIERSRMGERGKDDGEDRIQPPKKETRYDRLQSKSSLPYRTTEPPLLPHDRPSIVDIIHVQDDGEGQHSGYHRFNLHLIDRNEHRNEEELVVDSRTLSRVTLKDSTVPSVGRVGVPRPHLLYYHS